MVTTSVFYELTPKFQICKLTTGCGLNILKAGYDKIFEMPPYRLLIVDDHSDIRRMLRAGIESLGPDFRVLDMPSAEEALLEIARKPVDLLISDIRLPGISGLELIAKARRRIPDLKIILITALNDSGTRHQVSESGVDALYTKPLDMPDFLDGVERTLGIVRSILPPPPVSPPEVFSPSQSFSERITRLRQELSAVAVVLLGDQGQMLAQAGDVLEISALIPALLTTLSASSKVSMSLGVRPPRNLLWIAGQDSHLCLAHVGPSHALLTITSGQEEGKPMVINAVSAAAQDLLECLANLGAAPAAPENSFEEHPGIEILPEASADDLAEDGSDEDASEVEAIFQKPLKRKLATRDLDNFWETAARQSDPNNIGNASVISYDQAKKLGLAPKDKS